jgi:mycofactocin glycosyltransferase
MPSPRVKGVFRLSPGVRLIPGEEGGVILRRRPLRAVRVNRAAFSFLQRCEKGYSPATDEEGGDRVSLGSMLPVLDRLCQAELLFWEPPEEIDLPFVSIIVAVYNRAHEIGPCLESIMGLDYPETKREIIVVDDGSIDETPLIAARYDVKLIEEEKNRGQSAARNEGVAAARGDIVAFTDSDCIALPGWLRELVPYFEDSRNVLVGGYVASYFTTSRLDRYEEVKSPLCMGDRTVVGCGAGTDFYVPTCNLLVKKEAYVRVGGLNEEQRVGEDVDLCWKLKEEGFRLVYVPKGRVRHKHRNQFLQTFSRRFDYGTSEPLLHRMHPRSGKRYPWSSATMAILGLCALGLILGTWLPFALALIVLVADTLSRKRRYQRQIRIELPLAGIFKSTVETHFQLIYYLSSHLVRYHLVTMTALALVFRPLVPLVVAAVIVPSAAEFVMKRPRLIYPLFLFFYAAEQLSYQLGVLRGCIKEKAFTSYRIAFIVPKGTWLSRARSVLTRLWERRGKTHLSPKEMRHEPKT